MYLGRYLNYGSYWVYQIVRLNKQDLWIYFNFQMQHVTAKLLWWCGGWAHWIIRLYCLHDNTWCVHIYIYIYMMYIYIYDVCIYIYIYIYIKRHMVKTGNIHKFAVFIFYENRNFPRVLESCMSRSVLWWLL